MLIPPDGDGGALEAGGPESLEARLAASPQRRGFYSRGLALLDRVATERAGRAAAFRALAAAEQGAILSDLEEADRALNRPVRSLLQRLARKATRLLYQATAADTVALVQFLEGARLEAFDLFYSHPVGWQSVGYLGPPQFTGYPDYDRCR